MWHISMLRSADWYKQENLLLFPALIALNVLALAQAIICECCNGFEILESSTLYYNWWREVFIPTRLLVFTD